MKLCPTILGLVAVFWGLGEAQVTWPNAIDELEDVMFLNSGYRSRGFGAHVTPCSFSEFGAGRQTAAEWLRIGFHDMATTNVFFAPHGGIDASIQFELNDGENIGLGFNTTLHTYSNFLNSQLPIADLIALGVYASVRTCGGPIIPMRGGRVDATAAGPIGVPQPQNGQGIFTNQFSRMGFNTTDMIAMTACGHTLGGVHAGDFNNIVTPGTVANDFQLFDNTLEFDNAIATRYISGPDTDPLAVGISISSGRNSDTAVFTADNNVTLQAMTNAATFNSMCKSILQRMVEVVDPSLVSLSPIIAPYEVKPEGLQLTLLSGGATILFTGDIRVRTTTRSVSSVSITYLDRTGAAGGTITTTVSGTANGFDDSFTFFGINANLPSGTSISAFTVLVTDTSGTVETFNNNGAGFPISDSVIVQTPQSCLSNGNLTVLAAVRATLTTPVLLNVTQKVARNTGSPTPSPVPSLVSSSLTMVKGAAIGPYNIYSGSVTIGSTDGTKYGVGSGAFADTFKDTSALGTACSTVGTTIPSSTSTSSSTAGTKTSSSATATPTLAHKQTVGAYSYLGCYTEATNTRALSSASFYNYTGMTIEQCSSDCSGYSYFGVEYGGECYCGNVINTGSVLAALSDCSFICPGNTYEYCGAGNRLEMYELTSLISSSSSSVAPSTSSSSTTSSTSSTVPPTSTSSSVPTTSSTTKSSSSSLPSTSSTSQLSSSSTTQKSSSSVIVSATSTTSTSATASPTLTLGVKQTVGSYSFLGCYTEATNGRALSGASFFDYPAMTLEECAADCAGYTYWGVEYGGECYCGNAINTGSVLAALGDCSFICPGSPYEYCGAGNRLEMYMLGSTVASSSSSSVHISTSSKTSTSSSVKPSSSKTTSTSTSKSVSSSSSPKSSSTTSSKVTSSSSLRSSISSSVQPRTLSSTSSTLSTSTTSSTKPSTTSTSATPTQTAPAIKPTIGAYSYYGCQTEGTNIRALTGASYYDYPAMTLEECAADCAGYTYWGVEYGGECYCGNSWNTGSVNATESDCSFLCPGNDLEYCGAGNRLSSYYLR